MTRGTAWGERRAVERAGIAATLTGAISVATFPAMVLAVLAPVITDDLDLSRSAFGVLTTSIFVGGGLTSVWAGRLVDQLGGRRSLVMLYAVGSATLAGMALAPSYAWLLVAAFLAGFPGAVSNPVTNQVISAVVPPGRRGLLIGVKQSGAQIAQTAGGLVLPAVAVIAGWRGAALLVAALPLLGVVATRALLPVARRGAAIARGQDRLPLRGVVLWLTLYGLLMSIGTAAVVTYLPLYAFEALDLSLPAAGAVASAAGVAGFVGRVAWGRAAERVRSPALALVVIAVASVASVVGLLLAPEARWLVWPAAVVYGGTAGAWSAVGMMAVLTEVEPRFAGRASGVVLLGFYGGFVTSPILIGTLADRTGSYAVGWLLVGVVFLGSVVVAGHWHLRRRTTGGATEGGTGP